MKLVLPCLKRSDAQLREEVRHAMVLQLERLGAGLQQEQRSGAAEAVQRGLWLRLDLLMPLLPRMLIPSARPSSQNIPGDASRQQASDRDTLARAIFKLLASPLTRQETCVRDSAENLVDRLVSILYALLSRVPPAWVPTPNRRQQPPSDDTTFVDNMQAVLDSHSQKFPTELRQRLQIALPVLRPSQGLVLPATLGMGMPMATSSTQLPARPHDAHQPSAARSSGPRIGGAAGVGSAASGSSGRGHTTGGLVGGTSGTSWQHQRVDPWLLEGTTGYGANHGAHANRGTGMDGWGGDIANRKACAWLAGSVRLPRGNLRYATQE